jgi:phage recombination protein Bet
MEKELQNIEEKAISYLEAFGFTTSLTKQEQSQFIEIAKAFKLNPFKREIYCIPYQTKNGRKLSILTGYEVYLKRAERLGQLDGWKVETKGSIKDGSLKAIITIHRKDWKEPFSHEVYFVEYNQNNVFWRNKPITMLKKVCVCQGFRMAFPDDLGGMPYTSDELPDNMTKNGNGQARDITPQNEEKELEAKETKLDKNTTTFQKIIAYINHNKELSPTSKMEIIKDAKNNKDNEDELNKILAALDKAKQITDKTVDDKQEAKQQELEIY